MVVGIGGSYLGTKAIYEALQRKNQEEIKKDFYFLGCDLCVEEMQLILAEIAERKPLVLAISKSGTTLEPALALRMVYSILDQKFHKEASLRVVAITSPDSGKLLAMARHFGWKSFVVPENIGGRYSVLTPVGVAPLLLAGAAASEMLDGAQTFFNQSFDDANPLYSYVSARAYFGMDEGKNLEVLVYNRPRLGAFVEWWKQLFAESEGKAGKGLFPTGFLTTTDLHSLGQYLQDGRRNLFETFLLFKDKDDIQDRSLEKIEGFDDGLDHIVGKSVWNLNELVTEATIQAHRDGGANPLILRVEAGINLKTLGFLFAFFETACALSGGLLGVNPFDQPGVEAYKAKMKVLLSKM